MARKQIRARGPKYNKASLGSLSRRMLFTWFMLAGLILLFAPHNLTSKFQLTFARLFRWPLSIGRNISLSARTQQPLGDVVSRRKYNQLQNHLANVIEQRNQAYQKIKKLQALRNRLPLEGAKLVSADVIKASIDGTHSTLTIDHGRDDGLRKNQLVLGDNSIIGTISNLGWRTAQVKLFTDPTSNMEVRIGKLNLGRIMHGSGSDSAKIPLLSTKHKVKTGDIVLARKKPGLLNSPMIIGRVSQCKRDNENPSLWDITVRPACDIASLKDVAVIIMNPKEN